MYARVSEYLQDGKEIPYSLYVIAVSFSLYCIRATLLS